MRKETGIKEEEKQRIQDVLWRIGNGCRQAVELLGIGKLTFYNRLKALGIEIEKTSDICMDFLCLRKMDV
ncbi:MAG: hypothetical protein K2N13_01145 [Paraprevotella sp.]|nr:hypothetical protein [Paraprevotella sp.]